MEEQPESEQEPFTGDQPVNLPDITPIKTLNDGLVPKDADGWGLKPYPYSIVPPAHGNPTTEEAARLLEIFGDNERVLQVEQGLGFSGCFYGRYFSIFPMESKIGRAHV